MGIYYVAGVPYSDELYHHGIIGQKWGVRRYQNRDGSLTTEGRKHYGVHGSAKNKVFAYADSAVSQIGKTAKKAGAAVGKAASATAKYAGKRFKMNHPSLMSDQELKDYTQRLIAEKNYSQMMNQYESPSAAGRASKLVKNLLRDTTGVPFAVVRGVGSAAGDILKKGANTLADAGFRKLAQEMTKTSLERENDELNNRVRNKELREKLTDKKEGGLSKALKIMNDPNASESEIATANTILKNLNQSKTNYNLLFGLKTPSNQQVNTKSQESIASVMPSSGNEYRMRPLESMGDLGSKSGSATRSISYDTSKKGDHSYLEGRNDVTKMRFVPASAPAATFPAAASWLDSLNLEEMRRDLTRRR